MLHILTPVWDRTQVDLYYLRLFLSSHILLPWRPQISYIAIKKSNQFMSYVVSEVQANLVQMRILNIHRISMLNSMEEDCLCMIFRNDYFTHPTTSYHISLRIILAPLFHYYNINSSKPPNQPHDKTSTSCF